MSRWTAVSSKASCFSPEGCSVTTSLTSKGHAYTLSFTLKQTSTTPGPLFTSPDSQLRSGNGTSSKAMLVPARNAFALDYSLPVEQWVLASLIGQSGLASVTGGSDILPFTNVHAHTKSTMRTSKKLNTRLPPNTIEWYFHAVSGVIPILLTAIAQGKTQPMLLIND